MRNKLIATATIALSAFAVAAAPMLAEAQTRHRVLVCEKSKKSARTGTAVGAVGGGVLGNVLAGHGNKTEGTLLGAGVGAVVGHEVGKNKKKNCHYEYVRR